MEFSLRFVPDKLAKINRYPKGLQWDYVVLVKQTHTFESTIWTARSMEDMIKKRIVDKIEVGEKKKSE